MIPIIMPQIGQDSPRGTIVEWRKREGDPVAKGEVVLTVESDKAVFEVTAERAGILLNILHPAGAQVEILQPVAYLGDAGETAAPWPLVAGFAEAGPAAATSLPREPVAGLAEAGTKATTSPPHSPVAGLDLACEGWAKQAEAGPAAAAVAASPFALASPAVRRLARERNIDLRHVRGTGPAGRITLQDVEAAAARGQADDCQTPRHGHDRF